MNLHHIQTSVQNDNALTLCLRYIGEQDAIILCGDAINALLDTSWQQALAGTNVFILEQDMQSRGLATHLAPVISGLDIGVIDYATFVSLSLQYAKVITW
ncbi:sulfurtransferase complex subunit TusB [Shewanella sp. WXL01]|uniref:sulfurtransferase complex subunit TusB n=1 Tax=Shewanella sp. WXL01 TaxID=2709721 RepID=UPI0014386210|nr:sulfurtransferase complex subunit TusB [Shewanella sp. WXL01]NKF50597.1 sulfurtransferase complex subunit TusB [Shewanella sp. WXL01]